MKIIEDFCTGNSRYKANQIFSPKGIVLHSIGTPQPSAQSLHNYWKNNGSPYLTHYNLDDSVIYHNMPDNFKCWHVGSPGNAYWLGCEMGEPKQIKYTSGAKFTCSDLAAAQEYCKKTYQNAVELFAYICKKYGWNPQTAIHTHNEITVNRLSSTDHVDPEHLWKGLGLPYTLVSFKNDVNACMCNSPVTSDSTLPQLYRVRKSWSDAASQIGAFANLENAKEFAKKNPGYYVYNAAGALLYPFQTYLVKVTASALNVRSGAGTGFRVMTTVNNGGVYTIVEKSADGAWGLLKAYANSRNGWISLKYTQKL